MDNFAPLGPIASAEVDAKPSMSAMPGAGAADVGLRGSSHSPR